MEAIKFRAWVKTPNKYCPVSSINCDDGKVVSVTVMADGEPIILAPEMVNLQWRSEGGEE